MPEGVGGFEGYGSVWDSPAEDLGTVPKCMVFFVSGKLWLRQDGDGVYGKKTRGSEWGGYESTPLSALEDSGRQCHPDNYYLTPSSGCRTLHPNVA